MHAISSFRVSLYSLKKIYGRSIQLYHFLFSSNFHKNIEKFATFLFTPFFKYSKINTNKRSAIGKGGEDCR